MSQDEIETNDECLSNLLSDSQEYPSNNDEISLPSSISSSPLFKYRTTTLWRLLSGAAINLLLPFINGLMLGFGELFAHEAAFRLGWGGTKVFDNFIDYMMVMEIYQEFNKRDEK
ncbi:Mitochondrial import protein 1 [Erysiphe neolycopersici]|uniref:Mitochondrial import protein 1 n=1 Tax=Erysiphe neolycopersici TaxID=212602 RepID=A0A420I234_9PEZI|nr:Mitochondrial import protein 1 [Erysiphe neolycopersici]